MIKCPVCHTDLEYILGQKVGRCICGNYVENVTPDTWKKPECLEMHELWEQGKIGYNMIYSRLDKLYKK